MSLISLFLSDAKLYNSYRRMNGKLSDVDNALISLKSVLAFLSSRSGRFSLVLRVAIATRRYFLLGKLASWLLNWVYTSDIDVNAKFGAGLYFPHPFGIVVGGGASIGDVCVLFNDITLGKRYPGIEDGMPFIGSGVVIGVGARVLGGVKVGSYSVIGANSVVVKDVPSESTFARGKVKLGTYWDKCV